MSEEYLLQNVPRMSILLHSRTVMEKKDYLSTGILTHADGDMIEIEIGDYKSFELGEKVKVTVFTPVGAFAFTTSVIARDQGSLIVINPPENRRKFAEKRIFTRLEIEKSGLLEAIRSYERAQLQILSVPPTITIVNISINGIGFILEGDLKLKEGMYIMFSANIGVNLSCSAIIMRNDVKSHNESNYYGAQLVDVPDDQMKSLRAFLLTKQVQMYSESKKTNKKRVFK